jgi:hypothetical protein
MNMKDGNERLDYTCAAAAIVPADSRKYLALEGLTAPDIPATISGLPSDASTS